MKRAARSCLTLVAVVGQLSQNCVQPVRPTPEPYPSRSLKGDPPEIPLVQLETEIHTNQITQIATDRRGRWLVTASYDKTARIWDLATGKLLRVLRPPQALGNEGMLFAVALSPEGDRVAVAGDTGFFDGEGGSIYIFDRVTGKLLRRIPGLSFSVTRLAFSPDGNSLAAAAGNFVRLFDPITGKEAARDACDVHTYGLDFRHDGRRLITASLNGKLRLYEVGPASLRIVAVKTAPVSEQPFAVRFSPDGLRIAVGFLDSTKVAVLDAGSLALAFTPNTSGTQRDNLMAVSWSADGSFLYAAGRLLSAGKYTLRRWSASGRGAYVDIPLTNSSIKDLIALPEGKLAFAAADPTWGVVSPKNQIVIRKDGAAANFIGLLGGLRLSRDGARVRFGYLYAGEAPAVFDVAEENLGADQKGLAAPRVTTAGLTIDDWNEGYFPILNGKPLSLQEHEMSRCLAIAPKERGFALGTDWYLRLFDRRGVLVWKVVAPATTFAVNISEDERWVVAAYGDGTIRWHQMKDGKEVLAFFPHADRKLWIAWTPEGFFNASLGAEGLIGYHLNRGWEQEGEFVPFSRLVEGYLRPTLIARRLDAEGEHDVQEIVSVRDVRKVLRQTEPRIELLSISPGDAGEYELEGRTTNSGGGILHVALKVDGTEIKGRPIDLPTALVGRFKIAVPLPRGDHRVTVVAVDTRRGVASQPEERTLTGFSEGGPRALHVLAVGVTKYADSSLDLPFAAADARDVAQRFEAGATGLFERGVNPKTIVDSDATTSNIAKVLDEMLRSVSSDDTFVLYLAGHGTVLDESYYFLPYDTQSGDIASIRKNGVSEERLREWLGRLPLKALVLLDTCHAGEALKLAQDKDAISRVMRMTQRAIMAASTKKQFALEGYKGHGVFTYVLLDALAHADYTEDGVVDDEEVWIHLRRKVPQITEKNWHYIQTPMREFRGDAFPLTKPEATR